MTVKVQEHNADLRRAKAELEMWQWVKRMADDAKAARKAEEQRKADEAKPKPGEAQPAAPRGAGEPTGGGGPTSAPSPAPRKGAVEEGKELNAPLSETETNEFGKPFVLAKDGTTIFGVIDEPSGLKPAPIRLSLGENYVDEKGNHHGYGLLHIDAGHGEQIRQAGFQSIEEFVESVARNYTTIREGEKIAGHETYLLEVSDDHNNTLFVHSQGTVVIGI